jgi:tRNA/rRNA methyltransferase
MSKTAGNTAPARRHQASPDADEDARLRRIRIVLVRTSHPGNIGAAARAMLTMGVTRLTLCAPLRFPDPEATAMATGASDVLRDAEVIEKLDDALASAVLTIGFSARRRELAAPVLTLREAASRALEAAERGDVALVFGTEMSGLTNEELARCSLVATIPANPQFSSLNLAAAVQVAAYELRCAAGGEALWRAPRFVPATQADLQALHEHAERTLTALKFLNPQRPRRLMPRLRRLFARAALEHEEVNILQGILARVDELLPRRR